jgi:hypothetical protein
MTEPMRNTPTDRFTFVMESLLQIIFRRAFMAVPMQVAIYNRVRRLTTRMQWLLAHVEAGTLSPIRARKVAAVSAEKGRQAGCGKAVARVKNSLPRRRGWLTDLYPERPGYPNEFRQHGAWLLGLLQQAEFAALIAQAPERFGRVVRPLMHMMKMDVPEALRLPRRVRRKVPQPAPVVAATPASPVKKPPPGWTARFGLAIPRGIKRLPARCREKLA